MNIYLLITIIGIFLTLLSYRIYLYLIPKNVIMANLSKSWQFAFIISLTISIILSMVFWIYSFFNFKIIYPSIYITGLILFYIGSILWTPSIYLTFDKHTKYRWITIMTLVLSCIGLILLMIGMSWQNIIIDICLVYILFHYIMFDSIIWGQHYLSYNNKMN
jgi:hypothetical protein